MSEDEFREKAVKMRLSDEFIEKTIHEHNHEKFPLSFEAALECESSIGTIRTYEADENGHLVDREV